MYSWHNEMSKIIVDLLCIKAIYSVDIVHLKRVLLLLLLLLLKHTSEGAKKQRQMQND